MSFPETQEIVGAESLQTSAWDWFARVAFLAYWYNKHKEAEFLCRKSIVIAGHIDGCCHSENNTGSHFAEA